MWKYFIETSFCEYQKMVLNRSGVDLPKPKTKGNFLWDFSGFLPVTNFFWINSKTSFLFVKGAYQGRHKQMA